MGQEHYEPVQRKDNMKDFAWAVNKMKLGRAISKAKQYETEDEEEIKKLYISFGGKVLQTIKKVAKLTEEK